jgi:hypothetical protein
MITVYVNRVSCPAWSVVARGWGYTACGELIHFVGDVRPMRRLGERLEATGEPVAADVDNWQIIAVDPGKKESDPPMHTWN